jgi:iron(III) transport system substrate-binding protein
MFLLLFSSICLAACSNNSVVVYTSVDRVFSEPVLKAFEEETGIKVLAQYDVEANKTTGLVNRLIEEKEKPRADVFWNGEISYTLKLKEAGVLESYQTKEQASLPVNFVDRDYCWTAFGGRARIFIVNTDLLKPEQYPKSIMDFTSGERDLSKAGMAKPLFGTTATHAAALYASLGEESAYKLFSKIADSQVNIVDGNGAVRDLVASGKLAFGLTDTDDALSAMEKGLPVDIVFPDQGEGMPGTLIIPNSIGIVKGGPHRENAEKFVDYILRKSTMKRLIEMGWCQVSVRDVDARSPIVIKDLKVIDVSFDQIVDMLEASSADMTELFSD